MDDINSFEYQLSWGGGRYILFIDFKEKHLQKRWVHYKHGKHGPKNLNKEIILSDAHILLLKECISKLTQADAKPEPSGMPSMCASTIKIIRSSSTLTLEIPSEPYTENSKAVLRSAENILPSHS